MARRPKPLPKDSILKRPLEYRPGPVSLRGEDIQREIDLRIEAACRHYEIDPAAPNAERRLLVCLLSEKFEGGFKLVPEGGYKSGNKRKWTMERKLELAALMFERIAAGDSQLEAADKFSAALKLSGRPPQDPPSIRTRFSEIQKELRELKLGGEGITQMLWSFWHRNWYDTQK